MKIHRDKYILYAAVLISFSTLLACAMFRPEWSITSPTHKTLTSSAEKISWSPHPQAAYYGINVGTVEDRGRYCADQNLRGVTSFICNNLPLDGSPVYVRLIAYNDAGEPLRVLDSEYAGHRPEAPVYAAPVPIRPKTEPSDPLDLVPEDSLGIIGYSVNVTKDGEFNISVPLALPPGRLGMAPSVALNYSSRGGDGSVGLGWKVSGQSMISRCGSTFARDGINRPVKLNNSFDHFCLNGKRLVQIGDGSYRTENESFTRITAYNMGPDDYYGPDYFIAQTKKGRTVRFGCNDMDDQRCSASIIWLRKWIGSGYVLVPAGWAKAEVRDENGNYMRYDYIQTRNQSREITEPHPVHPKPAETVEFNLSQIEYTGNDKLRPRAQPKAQVRFLYNVRSGIGSESVHGFRLEGNRSMLNKILSFIEIKMYGQQVRHYGLQYETNEVKQPRLVSIYERDQDGNARKPLRFEWTEESSLLLEDKRDSGLLVPTYQDKNEVGYYPQVPLTGDVDGDGLTDIIYVKNDTWRIAFNTGNKHDVNDGTHWIVHDTGLAANSLPKHSDDENPSYRQHSLEGRPFGAPIDYNMDGLTDILLFPLNCERTWSVLKSDGTSFVKIDTEIDIYVAPDNYPPHDIDPANTYFTGSKGCYYHQIKGADKLTNTTYVADFNGDGIRDLLFIWKGHFYYDASWGNVVSRAKRHVHYRLGRVSGFGPARTIVGLTGAAWSASDREDERVIGMSYSDIFIDDTKILLMDVDGDGSTEFMVGDYRDTGKYRAYDLLADVYTWKETDLPYISSVENEYEQPISTYPAHYTKVADINGDGLSDVLFTYRHNILPNDECFTEAGYNYCPPCPADGCVRAWINRGGGKFLGGDQGLPALDHSWYTHFDFFTFSKSFDFDGNHSEDILFPAIPFECPVDHLLSEGIIDNAEQGSHIRKCGGWDILSGSRAFLSDIVGADDGWGNFFGPVGFPLSERHILPESDWISYAGSGSSSFYLRPLLIDADGDLTSEIWISLNTSGPDDVNAPVPNFTIYKKRKRPKNRIVKIRGSLIGIEPDFEGTPGWEDSWSYKIDYAPTMDPMVYTRDYDYRMDSGDDLPRTTCTFPQICKNPQKYVVSRIYRDGGINKDPAVTAFTYHDSRYDIKWGWLGFGQRTARREITSTTQTAFYDHITFDNEINRYPHLGKITRQAKRTLTGSGRGRKVSFQYSYETRRHHAGETYSSHLDEDSAETRETGNGGDTWDLLSSSSTDYDVDAYGNVTDVISRITDTSIQNEKHTLYLNDDAPTAWRLGLPIDNQRISQDAEGERKYRHETIEYYPDSRKVEKRTREPGNSDLEQVRILDYDGFGNPVKLTVDTDSGAYRISQVVYDPDGTFPVEVINPLGHMVVTAYYRGLGLPASRLDSNNVETRYQYNTLGDPLRTIHPDNTETHITYERVLNECGHNETKTEVRKEGLLNKKTYINRLGLVNRTETAEMNGNWITETYTYDHLRALDQVRMPEMPSVPMFKRFERDELGRTIKVTTCGIRCIQHESAYRGLSASHADGKGNRTTYLYGKDGMLREVEDAPGNVTHYEYGPFGTLEKIIDAEENETVFEYDDYNRLLKVISADTGTTTYTYDGFDQLLTQLDESGQSTTYHYDQLGRLVKRESSKDGSTMFEYDTRFLGALTNSQSPWGHQEVFTYDAIGRIIRKQSIIDGASFEMNYEYDDEGRLWKQHYPPSFIQPFCIQYNYSSNGGFVTSIEDLQDGKKYWELLETDKIGRATRYRHASGLVTYVDYWSGTMDVRSIRTADEDTDLLHLTYMYDNNRHLTSRRDHVADVYETFTYDSLNRLESSVAGGPGLFGTPGRSPIVVEHTRVDYSYDNIGNILYKSDVGSYAYEPDRPHLVRSVGERALGGERERTYTYDDIGNQITRPNETITYTSFNLPVQISSLNTRDRVTYEYDANNRRVKKSSPEKDTFYFEGYEMDIGGRTSTVKYFVPYGAMVVRKGQQGFPPMLQSATLQFIHGGFLGSTSMITSDAREVIQKVYFDPFGDAHASHWRGPKSRVDQQGYSYGFTGHEHDEAAGMNMINMRGRMYDPEIGRFLTADPLISDMVDMQSLNRYSYVRNNPASRIDPSGFFDCGSGGCTEYYGDTEVTVYYEGGESTYGEDWEQEVFQEIDPEVNPETYVESGGGMAGSDIDAAPENATPNMPAERSLAARVEDTVSVVQERHRQARSQLPPLARAVDQRAWSLIIDPLAFFFPLEDYAQDQGARLETYVAEDLIGLDPETHTALRVFAQILTIRQVATSSSNLNPARNLGPNVRPNPASGGAFDRLGNASTQPQQIPAASLTDAQFGSWLAERGRILAGYEAAVNAQAALPAEQALTQVNARLMAARSAPTLQQLEGAYPVWSGNFRPMTVLQVPGYGTVYPAWRGSGNNAVFNMVNESNGFAGPNFFGVPPNVFRGFLQRFVEPAFGR